MNILNNKETLKKLLIVGPLPPPIGGSPLTLKVMLSELEDYPDIDVRTINTSPVRQISKKMTGFNFEKVKRMFTILTKSRKYIQDCDVILVFANDLFAFTLVPLLLWFAKNHHKSFYLKPVGSGLDIFMETHGKIIKFFMLKVLRSMDGVLAQTKFLTEWLKNENCDNAYYLPGFRSIPLMQPLNQKSSNELRLIFLAHITLQKGPLVLLKSIQQINKQGYLKVRCDFYGPIHDDIRSEFNNILENTPGAQYLGIAEAGKGTETISKYDVLVLPTFFDKEGHTGVLIEAMLAGIPIISTQFRTIPELVEHGVNGLLVPVKDSESLAEAIMQLANEPELRQKMGKANFQKGFEFRSDIVVKKMVNILFQEESY